MLNSIKIMFWCLALSASLAIAEKDSDNNAFEQWFLVERNDRPAGFRYVKVWPCPDQGEGVLCTRSRMFVYVDLLVSEAVMDFKETATYSHDRVLDFEIENYVKMPFQSSQTLRAKGKTQANRLYVAVLDEKDRLIKQQDFSFKSFTQIRGLELRFDSRAVFLKPQEIRKEVFLNPLLGRLEEVEISSLGTKNVEASGQLGLVEGLKIKFPEGEVSLWRFENNRAYSALGNGALWRLMEKDKIIKEIRGRILEKSGYNIK
jgi:hypothetical protein